MDYEIVAIDEVSFQLTTNYKKMWFPRGEKPKGAFFWSNKKIIVFGAQRENHKLFYEFHIAQNSITFLSFIEGLLNELDKNKKYILLLDNAPWHKTKVVQKRFEQHKDWIKIEFIPPYSPELNPIETNWKVTRNAVTKSNYFKTIDDLQLSLELFWDEHIFTQNFMRYLCR